MKQESLRVILKHYTPNPENKIATMARICYADNETLQGIFSDREIDSLGDSKLVRKLVNSRHWSQLEYADYHFIISGVSRSLTHQLVRNRIASFSQRSQRYVGENDFSSIIPPSIGNNQESLNIYADVLDSIQKGYTKLIEQGIPKEDARYLLPNGCSSVIGLKMNARELLSSFFKERLCNRAQWEIRNLAKEMLKLTYPTAPNVFSIAGPSCFLDKKCYQGRSACGELSFVVDSFRVGGPFKNE